MAPWFLSCAEHDVETDEWTRRPTEFHAISLPNPKFSGGWLEMLTTQLTTWQPRETKRAQTTPTDAVMAMWFASIGIPAGAGPGPQRAPAPQQPLRHARRPQGPRRREPPRDAIEQKLRGQQEVSFHTGS
jgi:hypothetical protein